MFRTLPKAQYKNGALPAEKYVLGLHEAFRRLAEFPDIGRDARHIRPGYFRMEVASHTVFYRKTDEGILIIRVLHERMDFARHF
jgi:toxin ParE1/3/4